MVKDVTNEAPSLLEREAVSRALAGPRFIAWRPALLAQFESAFVSSRTEKSHGYYADFIVPDELRILDAPSDWLSSPPEAIAVLPDGKNMVFFVLYIKDGLISYLEASSTDAWPSDERGITFQVASD